MGGKGGGGEGEWKVFPSIYMIWNKGGGDGDEGEVKGRYSESSLYFNFLLNPQVH